MFHLWNSTRREAASHKSRRPRRFVPSALGSTSCLEERVVPAGGQATNFAQLAQSLATTRAAQVVNNLFQSILMTNPSDAQLVRDVRRLQHGTLTANGLRNQLLNSAPRQQLLSALNVNVNATPRAFVNSLFTNILNQTPTPSAARPFVDTINGGTNPQMVAQRFLNVVNPFVGGRTLTISNITSLPTTTTTTSTGTTGTTTSTAASTGTTGTVITPISQLPISQLPVTPLTFTPVTSVNNSPINASPVASPIPTSSSQVVNSPVNASPVSTIII
jgi:hypothetical protein